LKNQASPFAVTLAIAVAVVGLLLFLSLISFLSKENIQSLPLEFFSRPGVFLFESFLWAAFYVPAYLFISSLLLVRRPFEIGWLILLTLSIVPFLSISLLMKVIVEGEPLISTLSFTIIDRIGRIPGAILIILVSTIEILLLAQLKIFMEKKKEKHLDPEQTAPESETRFRESPEFESDNGSPLSEAATALSGTTGLIEGNPAEWERFQDERAFPGNDGVGDTEEGDAEEIGTLEVVQEEFQEPQGPQELVVVDQDRPVTTKRHRRYSVPVDGILNDYQDLDYWKVDEETREAGEVLMNTLQEFNITAELTGIQKGPVITMFEILPSPGVKLSRIVNLADNIALRLAALRVRIVAPIPGKHAVGIEVPNKQRVIVPFKEMITLDKFQQSRYEIPIVLGKDISGGAQIVDLVQTPHLLIAGATGSGKSVCVNSIISSILYRRSPEEVRLLLIDPKIVELKAYNDIPHLMTPVITDPKKSFQALQYCIYEMERRYALLDGLEVRDIHSYNRKIKRNRIATTPLPYIVIFIDEFADLMATSGKEMEATLARLAAMSRAVGLHLVLATQRPSVDVITGLIKANIPSRIAFMVASKFDSRIIIDTVGAEKLLGQGDMLFTSAWDPAPIRIQGAYLSEEEIEAITGCVKTLGEPEYLDDEIFFDEEEGDYIPDGEEDPLMDNALDVIMTAGKASASYLQRKLKIGYNRAARLIEHMEQRGIVGPANGSKPRDIIHIPERS
jgi:S-DNA-T family DNA segregation ATPase FtsK/SpoIIIE